MNNLQLGNALRDNGIANAVAHAESVYCDWQEEALKALKVFLLWNNSKFMCETFRAFAESECQLPTPPNNRAYGAVMVEAKKRKMIVHVGFGHVSNPRAHRTPASLWQNVGV